MSLNKRIREEADNLDAELVGFADLDLLRDYPTVPPSLLSGFSSGISIGVKLADSVIDGLPDSRPLYAHQYGLANDKLDRISCELASTIEEAGAKALSIPASKVVRTGHWQSFISHKAVARAAGLGWIGKSLLLINPEFGPRLRWTTILTDLELDSGKPVENQCGNCTDCIESCIVDAFTCYDFDDYPRERSSCLDVDRCASKLEEFAGDPDIGEMVCGICIKACPWGSTGDRPI